MRLAILLAMLAGLSVAIQISLTAAAQRVLGLRGLVAISGLTTGILTLTVSLVVGKLEFTGRSVGYAVASGVLGALVLGSISFAAGQAGLARALSLSLSLSLWSSPPNCSLASRWIVLGYSAPGQTSASSRPQGWS